MKSHRSLAFAMLLLAFPMLAADTDSLARVRFLTGEWAAVGGGKPGDPPA